MTDKDKWPRISDKEARDRIARAEFAAGHPSHVDPYVIALAHFAWVSRQSLLASEPGGVDRFELEQRVRFMLGLDRDVETANRIGTIGSEPQARTGWESEVMAKIERPSWLSRLGRWLRGER